MDEKKLLKRIEGQMDRANDKLLKAESDAERKFQEGRLAAYRHVRDIIEMEGEFQ